MTWLFKRNISKYKSRDLFQNQTSAMNREKKHLVSDPKRHEFPASTMPSEKQLK